MTTSPTPYQLLPRLTDDEYESLKADIAENGLRVPIDVDEDGVVLDGHHRAWIAAELGVDVPRRVVSGLTEQQKRNHARAVNVLRRHLDKDARREQVRQMRDEGQSVRMIAVTLGVPKSTVSDDLHLSGSGQVKADSEFPAPAPAVGAPRIAMAAREVLAELAGPESITPAEKNETVVEPSKPVTGLDGKTYSPQSKTTSSRKPLPEAAKNAGWELRKSMERIEKLFDDDRYRQNVEQVATALRGHLLYVAETVAAVLDQLP